MPAYPGAQALLPRMRTILALLAVLLTSSAMPAANAGDGTNCPGALDPVSQTPSGVVYSASASIRATFRGDGPGYIPGQCDIGWITTCSLVIDNAPVSGAYCYHTNGDDRCHESATVYQCDMVVAADVTLSPGTHIVQATLGMTWGCCLWQGGPEETETSTWTIVRVGI